MSDKSPRKSGSKKKAASTLKDKRTAKKLKTETRKSIIPPTGH